MKTIYLTLALFASVLPARSAVVVTYAEDPNVNLSSLLNTQVLDFNKMPLGQNKNVSWAGVGTFDQLFIKAADAYGGATDAAHPKGSNYSLQGAGAPVLSSTLTLNQASSYFGMWWSAGDSQNVLNFYLGDTLVSQFTTASLMDPLPSSYDGNPRDRSINKTEPYAFINFIADEKTAWDKIVLTNTNGSGFESDNYTSRVQAWDPLVDGALPGVPVVMVSGKTTTKVTAETLAGTRWTMDKSSVSALPGAPAPPWILLGAFGAAIVARARRQSQAQTEAA